MTVFDFSNGQKWWPMVLLLPAFYLLQSCCYSFPRQKIILQDSMSGKTHEIISKSDHTAISVEDTSFDPSPIPISISPGITHGAERMDILIPLLQGKRIALLINQSSVVGLTRVSLLDTLLASGIDIRKVFVPEHGFRGDVDAGKRVLSSTDPRTGIPIISLYGRTKKPTPEEVADIDIIVFDIQDVGCRFYTYISTMHYAMQTAAEQAKTFIVCDRPNPNDYIAGPVLDDDCRSFIGMHPIPILHGMTVGELAMMIDGEGWLGKNQRTNKPNTCRLSVIPLIGWKHGDPYSLPIAPSPNLPTDLAIKYYPSICFFEATIMSVGRGTTHPFQSVGYPHRAFGSFTFTPRPVKGADSAPVLNGKQCYGIDLRTQQFAGGLSIHWLVQYHKIAQANGFKLINRPRTFDLIAGTKQLAQQLKQGLSPQEIEASWQKGIQTFKLKRCKYLLYPDNPLHSKYPQRSEHNTKVIYSSKPQISPRET